MKHAWQQTIIMIVLMTGISAMFVGLFFVVKGSMNREKENSGVLVAEAETAVSETASPVPPAEAAESAVPPSLRQQETGEPAVDVSSAYAAESASEASPEARIFEKMLAGLSLRDARDSLIAEGEKKNAAYAASLKVKEFMERER